MPSFAMSDIMEIMIMIIFLSKKAKQRQTRGTTDPEIDSVTWIKFSNKMAPPAFVANLATRWRHLQ